MTRGEAFSERLARATEHKASFVGLALVAALAIGLSFRTPTEEVPRVATAQERHEMFAGIVNNENIARREVVKDFPADAWSQDDAFHEKEFQRIRNTANSHKVRFVDAIWGLDEGLRALRGKYRATVPPCRPRTIY